MLRRAGAIVFSVQGAGLLLLVRCRSQWCHDCQATVWQEGACCSSRARDIFCRWKQLGSMGDISNCFLLWRVGVLHSATMLPAFVTQAIIVNKAESVVRQHVLLVGLYNHSQINGMQSFSRSLQPISNLSHSHSEAIVCSVHCTYQTMHPHDQHIAAVHAGMSGYSKSFMNGLYWKPCISAITRNYL